MLDAVDRADLLDVVMERQGSSLDYRGLYCYRLFGLIDRSCLRARETEYCDEQVHDEGVEEVGDVTSSIRQNVVLSSKEDRYTSSSVYMVIRFLRTAFYRISLDNEFRTRRSKALEKFNGIHVIL